MRIRVEESGSSWEPESLSRGREGKGRWGFVRAGWGLLGKEGGLSGDSGKRFRVRWCARKLVSGSRGQGQVAGGRWQVGVTACWVGTVGQGGGLSGTLGRRFRVR